MREVGLHGFGYLPICIHFDFDAIITVTNFSTMCEDESANKGRSYTHKVPFFPTVYAKKTVKQLIRGKNHPLGNAFGNIDI